MDRGEIYLGPFLYSDLAGSKRRPMVVVSARSYNAGMDVVVAMISSGRASLRPGWAMWHSRTGNHQAFCAHPSSAPVAFR